MSPRLAVRDLTVVARRRGTEVSLLRGVSFEVRRGEVLGLIGESGCGKSVTLLAILGLLPPGLAIRSGSVRVDGRELVGASARELEALRGAQLGVVFQDPQNSLNPSLRVGDQVGESLAIHGLAHGRRDIRSRVVELLDEVGLPDPEGCARRFPHELSGGMQQRVLIAAALAARPRVLLADEPTTALDVRVQEDILELLRALNLEWAYSVVMVTHDLALASQFCDRIAVMYAGRIVEEGSAADVVGQPAHPYTQGLLGCLPNLGGGRTELRPIPGEVPAAEEVPVAGCSFAPRCSWQRPECLEGDIETRPAGQCHEARCVLVGR